REPEHGRGDDLVELAAPDEPLELHRAAHLGVVGERPDLRIPHSDSRSRAMSAKRKGGSDNRICSSMACAPPPWAPSPSSTAAPTAPAKLPSLPPPVPPSGRWNSRS